MSVSTLLAVRMSSFRARTWRERIVSKMVRRLSVDGNWISNTLKSEMNRGSTLLRAPPGGPIPAAHCKHKHRSLLKLSNPNNVTLAPWCIFKIIPDVQKHNTTVQQVLGEFPDISAPFWSTDRIAFQTSEHSTTHQGCSCIESKIRRDYKAVTSCFLCTLAPQIVLLRWVLITRIWFFISFSSVCKWSSTSLKWAAV